MLPEVLCGRNVVVNAETGSGKTLCTYVGTCDAHITGCESLESRIARPLTWLLNILKCRCAGNGREEKQMTGHTS